MKNHNARWLMVMFVIMLAIFLIAYKTSPAHAATRVWLHYGWLDNAFGSSAGIDQIAAKAARIPGVAQVTVHRFWETQATANEVMAAPKTDRIVISGYSCGANASTTIAAGLNGHRRVDLAVIQASKYCGGYPLGGNVGYAQETYASNCLLTLGFGCLPISRGQGFAGRLVYIERPDLHPLADLDPDAQADVLRVIAGQPQRAARRFGAPHGGVTHVVRYHGQKL